MKIGKKLTVEEVLSGNKMNFFVIFMLTWHYYSQALASPFAQTVFDQSEYSDYDTNFCQSMPMFECQILNKLDSPPLVTFYHGSYISVSSHI